MATTWIYERTWIGRWHLLTLTEYRKIESTVLDEEKLKRVQTFMYLGSIADKAVRMENEVNFKIQCG